MNLRNLTRRAGNTTVPAWPSIAWSPKASFQPGKDTLPMPGDGNLQSVRRLENDSGIELTIVFEANEYTGRLIRDGPPLAAVESLLTANLGRKIQAIGELDV